MHDSFDDFLKLFALPLDDVYHPRQGDSAGLSGRIVLRAWNSDGDLIHEVSQKNLITQAGDDYYSKRGAGVGGAPAIASGLKLGTGTTAASKTGAGAALVTYMAGTNIAFDSTPAYSLVSGTSKITYLGTWGAGVGTGSPTEIVIVNDATGNATSPAANTIARSVFTAPPVKAAGDIWTATWEHNFLGQ